jgi:uncharacterized protein YprB with RNaseH-like and TPR domain
MSQTTLHDKLRRLRRPPEAPDEVAAPGSESLGRLERSLLGAAAEDGVSLRERLLRLVAVAERRDRTRAARRHLEPWPAGDSWPPPAPEEGDPWPRGVLGVGGGPRMPLEEIVQGMRVANERGEFFLMENSVHLEAFHGEVPLVRFHSVRPETVGVLTAEDELAHFDLRSAVFLDTETTGLAGGAGTAAFLVGAGFVEGDHFKVRQYFMRDYHEEGALLHALATDLARFERVVTFNGKMFDMPLLDARFRLNRARFPLGVAPHFDLLHPARRLWKMRLESCRLQSLEKALLGLSRRGDIPGELIPQVYFDYVRRRDARALKRVFDHNRQDIVSLAALAILACQWVEEGRAEDPRDVVSLAGVLERAQLFDRSEAEYRRALDHAEGPLRRLTLLRLAYRAKRVRDFARAVALWREAGEDGEVEAFRELAMHYEHRVRDLGAALAATERGLVLVADGREPKDLRMADAFERRRRRLRRKLAAARRTAAAS